MAPGGSRPHPPSWCLCSAPRPGVRDPAVLSRAEEARFPPGGGQSHHRSQPWTARAPCPLPWVSWKKRWLYRRAFAVGLIRGAHRVGAPSTWDSSSTQRCSFAVGPGHGLRYGPCVFSVPKRFCWWNVSLLLCKYRRDVFAKPAMPTLWSLPGRSVWTSGLCCVWPPSRLRAS